MIRLWLVFMRRTLLTLAILGLVWIGYIAWPVYDLFVLIRAIETRDVNTLRGMYTSTRCAFRSPIKLLTPTCLAPGFRSVRLGET